MQIGELAKRTGVTVQTIRFYERSRLLPKPQRKNSGYRVYSETDLKRLRFVLQAKSLGFSLDEIREILRMRERRHCPCSEVVGIAERHLRDVEHQLQQLSTFRDGLRRAIRQWKTSGEQVISADAICALIERTAKSAKPARKPQSEKA